MAKKKDKKIKRKCRGCGKTTVKMYVIADDIENPKPYHKKCVDELYLKVLLEQCKGKKN